LESDVEEGRFREDLFYRINVVPLHIPPLRSRGNDILVLAQHFLERVCASSSKLVKGFSRAGAQRLLDYDWPGNVRELRNAVQRAVVLTDGPELSAADFSFLREASSPASGTEMPEGLTRWEQAERTNILAELSRQGGNKTRTARVLGIAKSTLFEKLKKYGIGSQEIDR